MACWCAVVDGAYVDPAMGGPELVQDPDNNNGSPMGCTPVTDPDLHEELLDASTNDELVVVSTHDSDWIDVRDAAFSEAENHCDAVADVQGGVGSTNDCNGILEDNVSPIVYVASRMCTTDEGTGASPDAWSDYYSLSNVISYNSTNDTYEIDQLFFKDMVKHPWWLMDDSARIALNASTDFAFVNVQSGDIVHALGLASHDVPQTINSHDVTSLAEVAVAYMQLWGETEFDLVVNRPGVGIITLSYEIVP